MRHPPSKVAAVAALLFIGACGVADAPTDAAGILLVTSGFTDDVWVLDAATGDSLGRHSLDLRRGETDEPHGIAVSPDGSHWYATLAHGSPTLWKFDARDNRLVGRLELPTRGASRIGIDPAGRRAWIPDYWRSGEGAVSEVAAVDLITLELFATPTVCSAPHDAQVDPEGDLVAITCALSDEVVLLDANTADEVGRIAPTGASDQAGSPKLRPMNVVWAADGSRFYVTLMGTHELATFSRSGEEVGRIGVGRNPAQLALVPHTNTLVAANRGDSTASIVTLDPATGQPLNSTRVGLPDAPHPHGVAVNQEGSVAFITFEGTTRSGGGVVALSLESREVLWRADVGAFTLGVAWTRRQ